MMRGWYVILRQFEPGASLVSRTRLLKSSNATRLGKKLNGRPVGAITGACQSTIVAVGGITDFQVIAPISHLESFLVVLAPLSYIFFNSLCKSSYGGADYLPFAVFDI